MPRPLLALVALAIAVPTLVPARTEAARPRKPAIVAHRGGWGRAPENTVAGMRRARALGASILEIDVRLSGPDAKGNRTLIAFHDRSLARTTNCRGYVDTMSMARISRCDAGYGVKDTKDRRWVGKGVRVPSLAAVFAAFPATKLMLEVKPQGDTAHDILEGRATAVALAAFLAKRASRDRSVFSRSLVVSLDSHVLTLAKHFDARIKTGLIGTSAHQLLGHALMSKAAHHDALLPADRAKDLSAETVKAMQDAGYKVYIHTANRPSNIRRMISYRPDGIWTDYPDRVRREIGRYRPKSSRPCVTSICI